MTNDLIETSLFIWFRILNRILLLLPPLLLLLLIIVILKFMSELVPLGSTPRDLPNPSALHLGSSPAFRRSASVRSWVQVYPYSPNHLAFHKSHLNPNFRYLIT